MDYIKTNREAWDKKTEVHAESEFYDVAGFLAGKTSLREIELSELRDVDGKTLLHLQCHFGLDTLSWARLGANVTGVDLSSNSIDKANFIKEKAGLEGRFICSDIYSFGETSRETYDIVFTSYGALCWLPDLDKWAEVVSHSLKPSGTFYIVEFHPLYDLVSGYSYFHKDEPTIETEGTYTENDPGDTSTVVTWAHPLSEVVNSLTTAGIHISRLNEYPFSPYNCFENMVEREKGRFYISRSGQDIPLLYTIIGTKNA